MDMSQPRLPNGLRFKDSRAVNTSLVEGSD